MKIGMMADFYKPYVSGVTSYIWQTKNYLEIAGHEVYIFTFGDHRVRDDEENIVRSPGVNLFIEGVYFNLRYSREARELLKTMDVLHVHHPITSALLAVRYGKDSGIPIVLTHHTRLDAYLKLTLPALVRPYALWTAKRYMSNLFRQVDAVIVPSISMMSVLRLFGLPENARFIPHGIDISLFTPDGAPYARESLGIRDDQIVGLYIGRLGYEKNLDFLIEAFNQALKTNPKLVLVLIGDGPGRRRLERKIRKFSIRDKVIFAGARQYESLPAYYRMGDIFVMPSLYETFGLTVVEAMACGLPVIGMDVPGVKDHIEDGVTGFLSAPEVNEFVNKIQNLAADAELRKQIGRQARAVVDRYSIQRSMSDLLDVYSDVHHERSITDE